MSFELSAVITSLQKEGISVADSGKTNARRVGAALRKRFGTRRQGLDFVALQLAVAQLVEDEMSRLLKIDHTHVHEVVDSRLQARQSNALYATVFAILAGIRGVVGSVYGDAARIRLFGDVSALPQNPLELHRLGVRVHDHLTDDGFTLPEVQLEGFAPIDRKAVAAGLRGPLGRFGEALATLSLERKDTDVTLFDKNEGVEEVKRTVRFAAGCLASLYGLAGFDDLAAKIRPKRRASRRSRGGPEGGSGGGNGQTAGTDAGKTAVADAGNTAGSDESGAAADSEGSESASGDEESADPDRGGGEAAAGGASGPIGIVR